MIQRPWDGTFDEYMTYTLREQDANKQHRPEDMKLTDAGRKVYSGGGVEPDRHFEGPVMGFTPSRFARTLYARNVSASFSERFSRRGDTRISIGAIQPSRELTTAFNVDDAMVAEFKQLVQQSPLPFDETDVLGKPP